MKIKKKILGDINFVLAMAAIALGAMHVWTTNDMWETTQQRAIRHAFLIVVVGYLAGSCVEQSMGDAE